MDERKYFERIAEYRLLAKHEVGQNFLIDASVASRIVSALDITKGDRVLEIGSGAGSLSFFLAEAGAQTDLIDIDEGLVTKLQEDFKGIESIRPMVSNALKHDCGGYSKIIGNLPYYITSGILEHVFQTAEACSKAVFMVQKEAFARITAKMGTEDYGPLNILLEYRSTISRLFTVPRTAFSPAPHIDSVVFSAVFNDNDPKLSGPLFKLTCALFLHRRKTILNNLSLHLKDGTRAREILASCGIPENKRPENLSLKDYLNLLHRCNEGRDE